MDGSGISTVLGGSGIDGGNEDDSDGMVLLWTLKMDGSGIDSGNVDVKLVVAVVG